MAQPPLLQQLRISADKIILCAKLSEFAYQSATPSKKISVDDNEARGKLFDLLGVDGRQPRGPIGHQPGTFARFASHSWWRSEKNQFNWFRSQAYFYQYFDQVDDVNRIVLAFRGTWNDGNASMTRYSTPDPGASWWAKRGPPAWYNWLSLSFPPSNIGLSDFYYDAIIVRIPYTDGTVWKWWAYWGAMVLERTRLWFLTWLFYPMRASAADWISRPNHDRIATSNPSRRVVDTDHGDVHLGFWSLWASPEGFAGYDRSGDLPTSAEKRRLLLKVQEALDAGLEGKQTEILVVGHSLGGAVSCFAALDLVRRLEHGEQGDEKIFGPRPVQDVKIFHATFGAPPVGDADFQRFFNSHFNQQDLNPPKNQSQHKSWSIYHQRDLVASIFAYCGTKTLVKRLGWWGDWRGVGHRVRLTHLVASPDNERNWLERIWDCISYYGRLTLFGFLTFDLLAFLYVSSWILGIPAALIYYPWYLLRYFVLNPRPREITMPEHGWGGGRRSRDPPPSQPVDTEYHSLHRYIELMVADRFQTRETQIMRWDALEGEVPM
ncbi:hypothetical protein H2200_002536 [Cladophialophora chaetospira]|uniref:Fungal lipase-type domain-containing protein n=1 Tax=Cladophialophora chaetospira TaxID=386627 RepID=A0AA38XJ20_9EURO|nr:hypothetical protein H2200_002536 [Cladophialophora chaetospira]